MRSAILWLSGVPVLLLLGIGLCRPAWLVERLGATDAWVSAAASLGSAEPPPLPLSDEPVQLSLELEQPLERVDDRFLSVAIDTSVLVGGHFWSPSGRVEVGRGNERVPAVDLSRPRLVELARQLAPGYLRVGGTEADHVYYAVGAARGQERPAAYELELDERTWNGLAEFARAAGFDLLFTVNAGPSARDDSGAWRSDNAEQLLDYAAARRDAVAVWELGNEVNGYWFIHGVLEQPSGERYAKDLWSFRRAVTARFPAARIAGPASAFFPLLGEPLFDWFGFSASVFASAGPALDVVSWHYYPEQSRRCPVATRRARPGHLLAPSELDEASRWSGELRTLRDRYAPAARLWLGETGPAQCGGEPGWSDRYASGLWWLDQLGSAARSGQAVVIRQALLGSDYGLLDERTLEPRPDYHNSLLWRRLMGATVLAVNVAAGNPFLRAYAHCSARGAGVSLLVLNLSPERAARFQIAGAPAKSLRFDLSAPSLDSRVVLMNGRVLTGVLAAELEGRVQQGSDGVLSLAPASYSFLELADWAAPACRAPRLWGQLDDRDEHLRDERTREQHGRGERLDTQRE
jgi:heparanase 1